VLINVVQKGIKLYAAQLVKDVLSYLPFKANFIKHFNNEMCYLSCIVEKCSCFDQTKESRHQTSNSQTVHIHTKLEMRVWMFTNNLFYM
jgi:hypothetical protein